MKERLMGYSEVKSIVALLQKIPMTYFEIAKEYGDGKEGKRHYKKGCESLFKNRIIRHENGTKKYILNYKKLAELLFEQLGSYSYSKLNKKDSEIVYDYLRSDAITEIVKSFIRDSPSTLNKRCIIFLIGNGAFMGTPYLDTLIKKYPEEKKLLKNVRKLYRKVFIPKEILKRKITSFTH